MRTHISAPTIANEVRMLRTQHKGAFLVVEGASDKAAFRHLTDQTACQIVIAHGRDNALAAMNILEAEDFPGVLAILDADFNHLENTPTSSGNILLTDMHDIECMMIASPAFGKVISEFAAPARIEALENQTGYAIAEALARNAMPLGYLRWVSLRQALGLRFEEETLAYHRFIARADLQIDIKELIEAIKDHSQRPEICSCFLEKEIAAVTDPSHDPFQVCCGHDILEILSFALRHTIASRNAQDVKRAVLERELRLAYQDTYFQQSGLARAIRNWQDAHRPYRVFPGP